MFLKDFFNSIKAYADAFALANQLQLWKYCLVPIIIGFITGTLIIVAAWFWAEPLGDQINRLWTFDFGKEVVESISFFLGIIFILLFGMIAYKHIVMAFSAPFMTPLSEKIETHFTGKQFKTESPAKFLASLVRGIRINVRNLLMEVSITLLLFICSIIPVINIFTSVLLLYVQCYFTGFGNMDYTLERYLNYADTKKFVRQHHGLAVGNGFVFHLFLMIPLVGMVLALPLSTIAATKVTVSKLNAAPQL